MNRFVFTISAALLACLNPAYSAPAQAVADTDVITDEAKARIDSMLSGFVEQGQVAGISSLIFEDGEEAYYGEFGYADREADVPMSRDAIVRIFSMTKPIVGVALMTLYDKGAFQLDDPLEKYAPEFANMQVYVGYDVEKGEVLLEPANRPITVRDITRHTAGFARAWDGMPALEGSDRPTDASNTLQEMAEKLGKLPLGFQPGAQWAYGDSVDVQAFLVERISGVPFEQYLRENVLDPLGMKETRYYVPEEDRDRFAATYKYDRNSGELTRVPDEDAQSYNFNRWPLTRGGWGLTSTLDDYQTFARMLANGGTLNDVTILKPETVKLMATNHLDESVTERMWLPSRGQVGFGIDFAVRLAPPVDEAENNGVVGEFFWDGALSTLFWVDPLNDLTAVMFVQLTPYDQIQLHNAFRDAVYGNYMPGGN